MLLNAENKFDAKEYEACRGSYHKSSSTCTASVMCSAFATGR